MIRRLLTAGAAALALAAFSTPASAQDPWGDGAGMQVWGPITLEFELDTLFLMPGEEVGFTIPGGSDNTYSDLFDMGLGFGLRVAMPFFQEAKDINSEITFAPFLSFDRVTLPGGDVNNPSGSVFSPDDWVQTAILVGAQLRMRSGNPAAPVRFLFGVNVGIGAILYDDVDADLAFAGGGGGVSGPVYDASSTFALRSILEIGAAIRLTPQFDLGVTLYGGVAIYGAPDGNSDPGNAFIDPDPDDLLGFVIGFAVSFRMRLPG